jgi:hypothetical protein
MAASDDLDDVLVGKCARVRDGLLCILRGNKQLYTHTKRMMCINNERMRWRARAASMRTCRERCLCQRVRHGTCVALHARHGAPADRRSPPRSAQLGSCHAPRRPPSSVLAIAPTRGPRCRHLLVHEPGGITRALNASCDYRMQGAHQDGSALLCRRQSAWR